MEMMMTEQKVRLQKKSLTVWRLLWESALINLKGRGRWLMTGDDRYSRRAWQPRPIRAEIQYVSLVMDV